MEEIRICAFFDALGTRNIMLGDDQTCRHALIDLVRQLAKRTGDYNANVQNLGLGIVMSPTAQSTTFSDNMAVSFPIKRMNIPGTVGNQTHTFYVEASDFFEHLIIQIVIAVWDGLKIGILFRGAVTVGRLVHDDEIIAGEALITAVELEKSTKMPQIEIASNVIDLVDDQGQPVVSDSIKNECLEQIDGKWFVRSLDLHMGYWREHNFYRQQNGKPSEEIPEVLARIRKGLDKKYETVCNCGTEQVREKWKWFMGKFERAFQSERWRSIPGAQEAACGKSD